MRSTLRAATGTRPLRAKTRPCRRLRHRHEGRSTSVLDVPAKTSPSSSPTLRPCENRRVTSCKVPSLKNGPYGSRRRTGPVAPSNTSHSTPGPRRKLWSVWGAVRPVLSSDTRPSESILQVTLLRSLDLPTVSSGVTSRPPVPFLGPDLLSTLPPPDSGNIVYRKRSLSETLKRVGCSIRRVYWKWRVTTSHPKYKRGRT